MFVVYVFYSLVQAYFILALPIISSAMAFFGRDCAGANVSELLAFAEAAVLQTAGSSCTVSVGSCFALPPGGSCRIQKTAVEDNSSKGETNANFFDPFGLTFPLGAARRTGCFILV